MLGLGLCGSLMRQEQPCVLHAGAAAALLFQALHYEHLPALYPLILQSQRLI